ncbi:MAG: hypothetical protein EBV03_07945 [Proteobacteria bacterium]|nr:hypothetical protein [Pseudomonadota bacterium]
MLHKGMQHPCMLHRLQAQQADMQHKAIRKDTHKGATRFRKDMCPVPVHHNRDRRITILRPVALR